MTSTTVEKTSGVFTIRHAEVQDFRYLGASAQVEIVFRDYLRWLDWGRAPEVMQEVFDAGATREGFYWQLLEAAPRRDLRKRKRAWLERQQDNASDLGEIPEQPTGGDAATTVGEFLEQWFDTYHPTLSRATELRYQGMITNHILPRLGSMPLHRLTALHVQELANQMLRNGFRGNGRTRGLSPGSVSACVALLRQALEHAVLWGVLSSNPVKGIRVPKAQQKEIQVVTTAQADRILAALTGSYGWLPTVIAYHTGMRRGEILALSWDSVNLDEGTLRVSRSYSLHDKRGPLFKEPKTRSGRRTVEIGPILAQILRNEHQHQMTASGAWHNEHNLVCTRRDGSFIRATALSELFAATARRLGIDMSFHGLRHTHVSMLVKARVPINVISARIGHSKPSITHDVYSHLLPGMSREAVERFEGILHPAAE